MGGSNQRIKLSKTEEYKTINVKEEISDIVVMKYGHTVISTTNGKIEIYNPQYFNLFTSKQFQTSRINTICEVHNNYLAIGSDDNTIKILNILEKEKIETVQTLNEHNYPIIQILFLSNGQICSLDLDNNIILYKKKLNGYVFNGKLRKGFFSYSSIFQVNEDEIICSSTNEGIKFWSMYYSVQDYKIKGIRIEDYKDIHKIKNILLNPGKNVFCNVNKEIVGGLGLDCIYLINIIRHDVEKKINFENVFFSCIITLSDGTFLLSQNDIINFSNRTIVQYKTNDNGDKWDVMSKKEFKESDEIKFIVQANNNTVITGKKIQFDVWKQGDNDD